MSRALFVIKTKARLCLSRCLIIRDTKSGHLHFTNYIWTLPIRVNVFVLRHLAATNPIRKYFQDSRAWDSSWRNMRTLILRKLWTMCLFALNTEAQWETAGNAPWNYCICLQRILALTCFSPIDHHEVELATDEKGMSANPYEVKFFIPFSTDEHILSGWHNQAINVEKNGHLHQVKDGAVRCCKIVKSIVRWWNWRIDLGAPSDYINEKIWHIQNLSDLPSVPQGAKWPGFHPRFPNSFL